MSLASYPHCDPRILHAPGKCEHCDKYPAAQKLRKVWQIAFTGESLTELPPQMRWMVDKAVLPCPADYIRGDAHQQWHRNWASIPQADGASALRDVTNPESFLDYLPGGPGRKRNDATVVRLKPHGYHEPHSKFGWAPGKQCDHTDMMNGNRCQNRTNGRLKCQVHAELPERKA